MDIFLPTRQTAFLIFFNLCLILLIFTQMKKALNFPYTVSNEKRYLSIFLMFIFVLFPFWGKDWFHYQEAYPELKSGYAGHMEEIYVWIAQNITYDYLSFRLIIWGGGLLLLLNLINKIPIKKDLVILVFCSVWIARYSYARVSLAMVILYWGSILLISRRCNLLQIMIAVMVMCSSLFFHKSVAFGLALVILSLLSLVLRSKYFITLLLILFPLLIGPLKDFIGDFLLMDIAEEGVWGDIASGRGYLQGEVTEYGIGASLARVLEFVPYYLIAILCVKYIRSNVSNKKNDSAPRVIVFLMRYQVIGVLVSTLFFFNLGYGDTSLIAGRFFRFFAIPSSILLAYFIENRFSIRLSHSTFYIGFCGLLYGILYTMYNCWY